jgi:hypothetical protein
MKFTICGSARFESEWHAYNKKLGLAGHISYSLMTFPSVEGDKSWYTDDEKETLDLAHLAKIEKATPYWFLTLETISATVLDVRSSGPSYEKN